LADVTAPLPNSSLVQPVTLRERIDAPRRITLGGAGVVVVLVVLLLGFIAYNGVQLFTAQGVPISEIFSPTWAPDAGLQTEFGLLPFILGTLGVMVLAGIIATPLSVGLAIFMSEIAPNWAKSITRPAMEVFVGIPSVVYGWLGLTILVPFLRQNFHTLGFNVGFSWFAGSLVLAVMILPTITSISYDTFLSLPDELRAGSLALGTTRWQLIRHILLRAATTGVITGIVLGLMRAAGEALAVQMVIGNRPVVPTAVTQPVTTLTSQIALDMGNTVTGSAWNDALWTMGLVLLVISFTFVLTVRYISRRGALK
jgi:phosphate transport system permease protein